MQKWASEVAATGTFSAPLGSSGPGGLPVPFLVIGNKADIAAKEGTRGSSGNLVDAARQWVEKQGLLPSSEELPLTETFPGRTGLVVVGNPSSNVNVWRCIPSCTCSLLFYSFITLLLYSPQALEDRDCSR